MVKSKRTAAVAVLLAVLPGCAATPTSPMVPGSSQTTSASRASVPPSGRVLYVADLDGQPGVGRIHVYQATMSNPKWIRDITKGTGRPFGLWVDDRNDLYVANQTNKFPLSVTIFKPGASAPFFTISNLQGQPGTVAVDAQHNVYVNENVQDAGIVQVFAPHSNTVLRTINTGIAGYAFQPGGMAFDPQGNLIVGEEARLQMHVVKIAPGSTVATPVNLDLTNVNGPALGIDQAGNLYVSSSESAQIAVYPPGKTEPSRFISQVSGYGQMSVTPEGAVYESSGEYSVAEIAPGASTPTNTVTCSCSTQGVAVSH